MKFGKSHHFWSWFSRSQDTYRRLYAMPNSSCRFWLSELNVHLAAFQPMLIAQLYLDTHHWKKGQVVISANGCRKYFSSAERLVDKAPQLQRWEFIALHPPMPLQYSVEAKLKLLKIPLDGLLFSPLALTDDEERVELPIYSSSVGAIQTFGQQVVKQVVFNILGESDFGRRVGSVHVLPMELASPVLRKQLVGLAQLPMHMGCKHRKRYALDKSGLLVLDLFDTVRFGLGSSLAKT